MDISLKPVDKSDWDFIMELRNDFYHFFYVQKKPINKKEHYNYMKKQTNNPSFHQWIIYFNNHNVGYVRILNNDVGIMIKKEYQNKGIASQTLKLVQNKALKLGLDKLIAIVDVNNKSSKKIFVNNNFKLKMNWYELDLKSSIS